jgi:iron complex outermembrane receptor protein
MLITAAGFAWALSPCAAAPGPDAQPRAGVPAQGDRAAEAEHCTIILVTAPATGGRVLPPTVTMAGEALIARQPRSIADALRGLPGVSARPNSRGETVPRIRGSEERQTTVFLDGAPLAVPWDGRFDLALLPTGLIGRIDVRKGATSIEYGANAVAGVVDLQSRRGGNGSGSLGLIQAGTYGLIETSAVVGGRVSGADVTLAGSRQVQDASRLADPAALPFSQNDSRRRTNSRSAASTVFAAIGDSSGALEWRASLLHFDAKRGIAPESDRDPTLFAPRYWRYPAISFTQATILARAEIGRNANLHGVVWRQWYDQTIDAYRSADYSALRGREQGADRTSGGRLTLSHPVGPFRARWSASAQTTTHVQIDTALPGAAAAPLRYRQDLVSLGAEADLPLGERTQLTLGLGYDRSSNPLTGDKPGHPASGAGTFSVNLRKRLDARWALSLSTGRRTRFPSPRELFGEALGRFLPNPELKPETAWLADLELSFRSPALNLSLNPFLMRNLNGIGQRVVRVGAQSLRQRYNVDGTTSFGVDALLAASAGPWSLELGGTILDARADSGAAPFRGLIQRPAYEGLVALAWEPADALDLRAELRLIGPAVDLGPGGTYSRLPPAAELNLRASVGLMPIGSSRRLLATLAVDNATDALILPQLGLPLPGRTVRVGIRIQ